jgi:hypothetical protein
VGGPDPSCCACSERTWRCAARPGKAYFRPALDTAAFFETLFALAQRDELDRNGMPKLLPLVSLVGEFGEAIRPVSPPWPLLRALAAPLAPIARARGHRGRLTLQA